MLGLITLLRQNPDFRFENAGRGHFSDRIGWSLAHRLRIMQRQVVAGIGRNAITAFTPAKEPRQNKVSNLNLATSWQERVIPFAVEVMALEIYRGKLFVADFGAGWIV